MRTRTLVIGGGLSGLCVAARLAQQGRDFVLVEAQGRLGGRILTKTHRAGHFDLGPTWFWPGQPRIAALVDRLGLSRFTQFDRGLLSFEDEQGRVGRGRGFAPMEGSYRLEGGLGALIDALAAELPHRRVRLSTPITSLARMDGGIAATGPAGNIIYAQRTVIAMPPRIASRMTFSPALSAPTHTAMTSVATWMAGQAKAIAIYDTPFWRNAGLSGDAMSRRGPMVEIHDASPARGGPYALFGFIGVPPRARTHEEVLRRELTAQLVRLFGPDAAAPTALFVKDWAFDPFISTKRDLQPLHTHPQYGLPETMRDIWRGRVVFAGTEAAAQFGGYLEGALEAAEDALALLEREEA